MTELKKLKSIIKNNATTMIFEISEILKNIDSEIEEERLRRRTTKIISEQANLTKNLALFRKFMKK